MIDELMELLTVAILTFFLALVFIIAGGLYGF